MEGLLPFMEKCEEMEMKRDTAFRFLPDCKEGNALQCNDVVNSTEDKVLR